MPKTKTKLKQEIVKLKFKKNLKQKPKNNLKSRAADIND